ncbi:MAG: ATP phosphoribosyltransferase [Oscillospiraceae bacterium]|nr:ATP phosphoribosyltransferase [Oscillospiraceae bacterium]
MKRLRIAVTKGRLLEDSVALFEKAGLDCAALKADTRKLILPIADYPLDVILAKAPDVLTYVTHGVCDLGIVGRDTILEHGGSFYEMLDLGYGACRFALAVRQGDDFYGSYRTRRVATKYPNVTKRYFAEKGMDVETIKIEGSVELGPILGLSDAIMDVVQTGTTLKENGLVPIEDVAQISARLIANPASVKLHRAEVLDFVEKCEAAL